MSIAYDEYLIRHKENVVKGMMWIKDNLPEYITGDEEWLATFQHDSSKTSQEEYDAYDANFYGRNKSWVVVSEFKKAWLHHIHNNPHHWQHWVLINDEAAEGTECIPMPLEYALEMVCDWWSFSWNSGNLTEIYDWYVEHKDNMKLHYNTRIFVEDLIDAIMVKLEEEK